MHRARIWLQGLFSIVIALSLSIPAPALAFAEAGATNQGGETTSGIADPSDTVEVEEETANDLSDGASASQLEEAKPSEVDQDLSSESSAYDPTLVTASEAITVLYIDLLTLESGAEQQIAVFLSDESIEMTSAVLTVRHAWSDEECAIASDQAKAYVALFSFETQGWKNGDWVLVRLEYVANGVTTAIDLGECDPGSFTITSKAASDKSGFIDDSFYAVDGDELIETSTLEEAIQEADAETSGVSLMSTRSSARSGVIIGLDPGHGYTSVNSNGSVNGDPGAVGFVREADLTWKIAKYCEEELNQYVGISNIAFSRSQYEYTNDNSNGLYNRVKRLADAGADVIVSIHLNATTGGTSGNGKGFEVYVPNSSGAPWIHQEGVSLGACIADQLEALGITPRGSLEGHDGLKERDGSSGADYYSIIRNAKNMGIPALIVEHAFIDNQSDYQKFLSDESKIKALGIADATGIAKYFDLAKWSWDAKVSAVSAGNSSKVQVVVEGGNTPNGITAVEAGVWGDTGGTNDLHWYSARKSGENWLLEVNLNNHKETGLFNVHVYARMSTGPTKIVGATSFEVEGPKASLRLLSDGDTENEGDFSLWKGQRPK